MKKTSALACLIMLAGHPATFAEEAKEGKMEAKANESSPLQDGDYVLNLTHSADLSQVKSPMDVIPDKAFKPEKNPETLKLHFSEQGKKVAIDANVTIDGDGDAGTLEEKTGSEWVYHLSRGASGAGAQLRLKKTAAGITGTFTNFGSGVPVLYSKQGKVIPAKAAKAGPASSK